MNVSSQLPLALHNEISAPNVHEAKCNTELYRMWWREENSNAPTPISTLAVEPALNHFTDLAITEEWTFLYILREIFVTWWAKQDFMILHRIFLTIP
jgi:hypothetical protein